MTVGIGNADPPRDREIVNLTAGEPLLPGLDRRKRIGDEQRLRNRSVEFASAPTAADRGAPDDADCRRRARPRGVHRFARA
jgi:hypothetical protein